MSVQCKNCGVWMATRMHPSRTHHPSLPNAIDGDSNEKKVEKRRDSISAMQELWGVDGNENASVANASPSLPNAIDGDSNEKKVEKRRDSVGAIQDLWGVDGSGNASVANASPSLPNAIDGDSSEKKVGKRRDSVGAMQELWGRRSQRKFIRHNCIALVAQRHRRRQ